MRASAGGISIPTTTNLTNFSGNTLTGYPEGDYACRTGECPADLESQLNQVLIVVNVFLGFSIIIAFLGIATFIRRRRVR